MKTTRNPLPSLLSAIVFVVGALFMFGIALLMGIAALAGIFTGMDIQAQQTIFLVAFGFEGIILSLMAFFAFQKFFQRPSVDREVSVPNSNSVIVALVVIAVVSILVGYLAGSINMLGWLLLPILTIPVIVLPLGVLLIFGTRRLPFGTRWQTSHVLGMSMSLAPLLLFSIEILVIVIIIFLFVAYVSSQPALAAEMRELAQQLQFLGRDSDAVLELLSPYLTNPAVIVTVLIFMAVIVPVVEEIIKPLGVWFFAGKLKSQAQGFALGALSGAGYALIETIGVSGQAQAADWATLLFTRIGTGLLHITTSALMGGAIFLVWRERRYLRALGIYASAITLHGLWNTVAILFSFSSLSEMLDGAGLFPAMQPALVVAMFVLAVVLLLILVTSNQRMMKSIPPAPLPEPVLVESTNIGETM